jgi:hypothetical protein
LITLGEIDNALDERNDSANSTGENCDDNLNDSFVLVTKNELMNAQTTEQNGTYPSRDFLVVDRCSIGHGLILILNLRCWCAAYGCPTVTAKTATARS